MNIKKFLFPLIGIIVASLIIGISHYITTSTALKETPDTEFDNIIKEKISNLVDPSKSEADFSSSNPYDYIKNNENYTFIITNGSKSLNYMLKAFSESSNDGLQEYIMALACSEILKEKDKTWSTGKDWYDKYVRSGT
ncbi:hypothetical protein DFR58_10779 [Anaerobacterium chartisolvens]|uniref:Uncharacterized protein n=1 Tax=Anaerobacterium chartisolvens TaxID=1297424 RepID=A0A369B7N3_9FIRM|nr:hypothetical protein [Anaerobacterium chartisolvens]RCX17533.1 hypothetical protein DFR58_10779 [Anaerobacterium chartisolvens]